MLLLFWLKHRCTHSLVFEIRSLTLLARLCMIKLQLQAENYFSDILITLDED